MPIETADEFKQAVARIQTNPNYREPLAFGICQVQQDHSEIGRILTCNFPVVNWNENFGSAAIFMNTMGLIRNANLYEVPEIVTTITEGQAHALLNSFKPFHGATGQDHLNVQLVEAMNMPGRGLDGYRLAVVFDDVAQQSVPAAYLKLAAISAGKVKAADVNLSGIEKSLLPLAWGDKAYDLGHLRNNEVKLRTLRQYPKISRVDKLPLYLDQITPPAGVEIADNAYVPLGVYLAPGTKVMSGAHIGLGAATGEKCILGPNSVIDITLGDYCIMGANAVIHDESEVYVSPKDRKRLAAVNLGSAFGGKEGTDIKGRDLTGMRGLYIVSQSRNGGVTASCNRLAPL